jgi:hypothetical protein
MSLPSTVRVKISSEAADMISLSSVVIQEMPIAELVEAIVSAVGKNGPRLRESLQRGTQVIGSSRFRWDRLDVSDADVDRLLVPFPDPDPARAFDVLRCDRFVLRGAVSQIAIDVSAARRCRLFRRPSLWQEIAGIAGAATYAGYSYKERADTYRLLLDPSLQKRVREAARLSPYSSISRQIEAAKLDAIEFFVKR